MSSRPTPSWVAVEVRHVLKQGGSTQHAAGVQHFFKEEIQSHGWHTAALRRAANGYRREISNQSGREFLLRTADKLFSGRVLEEKIFAVFLLERLTTEFGDEEFRLFESWLDRISSWADHDALVHYLIAPMVVADKARLADVFRWAKSHNRWRRRAACVSLIRGARHKAYFLEIKRLPEMLLADENDMVQKGLAWLLRETAKADPARTVPYLLKIRNRAPRLVLRAACETLPAASRSRVLS